MSYSQASRLTGRIDGTSKDVIRFHQAIEYIDLNSQKISIKEEQKAFVFLEFASDEGVRRNQGRVGAAKGAEAIAKAMASFPLHDENIRLFHAGVVKCEDENLEKAHQELAVYVEKIIAFKATPIVLGGGHEVTYGHHLGIKKSLPNKKIGIINFDAHFDLRPIDPNIGATSGTSIWQIANESKKDFGCLALGIQKYSNTKLLFDLAHKLNVEYILGSDFCYENVDEIKKITKNFINDFDAIYLTICMDVFASCYAPGVSAPSFNGIAPDKIFLDIFDSIIKSGRVVAIDFAETNPNFDIDSRTAKLAASLIFQIIDLASFPKPFAVRLPKYRNRFLPFLSSMKKNFSKL